MIFSFIFSQEKLVLKKLKFRLNEPTPYVFMLRFLKAAQSDKKACNTFRKFQEITWLNDEFAC